MRVEIANFRLEKAGQATDKTVPVRMVANQLELDRENQKITAEAFNKSTVDRFLRHGVVDWFHKTVTSRDPVVQAKAVIGRPTRFEWENKKPVVYADLTKANPIVAEAILPHLEADMPVFSASVGGDVRKARRVFDASVQKDVDHIYEFEWNHIAIAPAPYTMSPGCTVTIAKAGVGLGIVENETLVYFEDLGAFSLGQNIFQDENKIRKAVMVGAGTDSATLFGGDTLRMQSLEGAENEGPDIETLTKYMIMGLASGDIAPNRAGIEKFARQVGIPTSRKEATVQRLVRIARESINAAKRR